MERLAPKRSEGGGRTVTAPIAGNVAVATAKFMAAALTGSSAILRAGELAEAVARIERRLKERHPELKYLFLEGTCLTASG